MTCHAHFGWHSFAQQCQTGCSKFSFHGAASFEPPPSTCKCHAICPTESIEIPAPRTEVQPNGHRYLSFSLRQSKSALNHFQTAQWFPRFTLGTFPRHGSPTDSRDDATASRATSSQALRQCDPLPTPLGVTPSSCRRRTDSHSRKTPYRVAKQTVTIWCESSNVPLFSQRLLPSTNTLGPTHCTHALFFFFF